MTKALDQTHDPAVLSWVDSARRPNGDFPIQNLPFGVFRRRGRGEAPRIGVAIGDEIVDLSRAVGQGLLTGVDHDVQAAASSRSLNALMALGRDGARQLRHRLFTLLDERTPDRQGLSGCLVPVETVDLLLPVEIGDYTDFYASIHHATNIGTMFRPESPLLPNYKFVPIGYHGRASSIVVGGTAVRRPMGQIKDDQAPAPVFGPTRALDYECEIGAYIASGNALGTEIRLADAEQHLFGMSLLNDWSARDIQRWEYQPLGPFLAKNFATSVSPWVVTADALAPFRVPGFDRPAGDPDPLPYLFSDANQRGGGIDIAVEVWLSTARMRAENVAAVRLSQSSLATMYWTMAQLITHHASNGCNLRPGDLLGSGTISGPARDSRGCLQEMVGRAGESITLPGGEQRRFLLDGDEVTLRGFCERPGAARIGLGECRGLVIPA